MRGGLRPGAGRPRGAGKKDPALCRQMVSVRLPAWIIEWMASRPEPQSRLIEQALCRTFELIPPDSRDQDASEGKLL